ncbi:hypothetical protein Zmor_014151 [Zophobas morio]|uniref:Uncharacterized protein n=1 Tax=Zophobas morio TaxID=2755281 RepID=A0AA38IBP0_9CUCU|nr:hypothetical protein Zmor_014151 [Zophobas morio]
MNETTGAILPDNVVESAEEAPQAFIATKSKVIYEKCYSDFQHWHQINICAEIVSENVLLTYFQQLSTKHSSSALWVYCSILRCTINKNIDIK